MNLEQACEGNELTAMIGETEFRYRKLTMQDFAKLAGMMPGDGPKRYNHELLDWIEEPDGILALLELAAADPTINAEALSQNATPNQLLAAAVRVYKVSNGIDPDAKPDEKKQEG